jgi:hypothetical protein
MHSAHRCPALRAQPSTSSQIQFNNWLGTLAVAALADRADEFVRYEEILELYQAKTILRGLSEINIFLPERGGHSISQVLLTRSEGSQLPSEAQATTILPVFCFTDPSSINGSLTLNPVSSLNSRIAATSGSSSVLYSPLGRVQEPSFFFDQ